MQSCPGIFRTARSSSPVFPGKDAAKESCKGLDSAAGYIRRELLHRLKIRRSPVLHFVADDSIAHSAEIDRMLHQIQPAVEDIPEDDSTEKE